MAEKKIENIFDYINPRMFSILSSKDRRSNYELLRVLQELFDRNSGKVGLDKDDLVDALSAFIKGRDFSEFDDDEGNSIADRTPRDKALFKIRQFKSTGWLEEDTTEGFSTVFFFSDYADDMMNTFTAMMDRNEHQIEYTGYFYGIHNNLMNFDFRRTKALLEQVYESTRSLFANLRGLNSTIRKYIERLINRTDITPNEIMEILLDKYRSQVIMGAFNNLLGRDNPSRYTTDILEKLRGLRYDPDNMSRMVQSYTETAGGDFSAPSLRKNEQYIKDTLDFLLSRFDEVDDLIHVIDSRNTKFHVSAVSRLNFLINTRKDIEGLLVQAMKSLAKADVDQDFDDITPLHRVAGIDGKSLFARSFNKDRSTTYAVNEPPQVSQEEVDEAFSRLEKNNRMSHEKADRYAMDLLGDLPSFSSESITDADTEELMKLMAIEIFGAYEGMDYKVNYRDDEQKVAGYRTKAFDIIRKERTEGTDGR